jgi:hypothetical protein
MYGDTNLFALRLESKPICNGFQVMSIQYGHCREITSQKQHTQYFSETGTF